MGDNPRCGIGRPLLRRRVILSLLPALVATLLVATPTLAKVPYFTIELQGGPPAPGESLGIVVRMYEDARHTTTADWMGDSIEGLVSVLPAGGSAGDSMDVLLVRTAPGVYRGSVVIPRAGTWIVRPFPDAGSWREGFVDGYPDDMTVQVAEPGPSLAVIASIAVALVTIPGLAAIIGKRLLEHLEPQTRPAG